MFGLFGFVDFSIWGSGDCVQISGFFGLPNSAFCFVWGCSDGDLGTPPPSLVSVWNKSLPPWSWGGWACVVGLGETLGWGETLSGGATGPPRQAMGPPRSGADVGVGMLRGRGTTHLAT